MIKWPLVFGFWGTFFIPLLYLLNIFVIFESSNSFQETVGLKFLGIILTIIGLIIWSISYLNLGRSFGVLPEKQKRVTSGLYKYLNHPMYVGISLTMLGLSLANASVNGLIFYNLILLPILLLRTHFEAKLLR